MKKNILLVDFLLHRDKKDSYLCYSSSLFLLQNLFEKEGVKAEILNLGELASEITYENFSDLILEKNPNYVGFSAMVNNYVNIIVLAEKIKNKSPETTIFLGGPQASIVAKETLENFPWIDFICCGEVEKIIPDLVKYFNDTQDLRKIKNIARREKDKVIENTQAPLLSGDEIPKMRYNKSFKKEVRVEGGRGCPYSCSFCSASIYWKNKFRPKSVKNLVSEIKKIKEETETDTITIIHDNFFTNRSDIIDFCKKIKSVDINWSCSVRADCLSPETIDLMSSSGCKSLFIGIESGDKKCQKIIGKNLDLNHADKIIKRASVENRMEVTTFFIIGFPHEAPEQIYKTVRKIAEYKNYNCLVSVNDLSPIKKNLEKQKLLFHPIFFERKPGYFSIYPEKEYPLIRNYPEIFFPHYRMQGENFSPYFPVALVHLINRLLLRFPKTFSSWVLSIDSNQFINDLEKITKSDDVFQISEKELSEIFDSSKILLNFIQEMEKKEDSNLKTSLEKDLSELKNPVHS